MRKVTILITILFIMSGCNYGSIEEAVQSRWKTPIEIVNQDAERQLVYYLDHDQHILGVYHYKNGKYRYNNKQSIGITFGSANGLPFFIQANYFEGVGNIIHGAIKTDEHHVEKFVIQYKNGEQQEITANNNTFITEFPTFLTTGILMFQTEIENVIGYDIQGKIVESYYTYR